MNFMHFCARQMREIMARLGFRTLDEMTGHTECLRVRPEPITDRAALLDLSYLLGEERESLRGREGAAFMPKKSYDFKLDKTLDERILLPALEELSEAEDTKKTVSVKVCCSDRAFGTIAGSVITRRYKNSLPDDSFIVEAQGGAGQSLGAFLPKGMTIRLHGDANDGAGKGLSGGKIVIVPPKGSRFDSRSNIILGNVALYGATGGRFYACGVAGERFCVRNSGAIAVAEGCGDHGLEYMTGGCAVILGSVGRNFAAGMSGGIAYVLDQEHQLYRHLNREMVIMSPITEKSDATSLKQILSDYVQETSSKLGSEVLDNFDEYLPLFKKIIPTGYHTMLEKIGKYESKGLSRDKAEWEAFREMA